MNIIVDLVGYLSKDHAFDVFQEVKKEEIPQNFA